MKKTLTLILVPVIILVAFSSCRKTYTCKCNIQYVVKNEVVGTNNTATTLRETNKEDAEAQCVYYETEDSYLQQKTVVKHYCGIAEED